MSLVNEYTANFFADGSLILDAHVRLLFHAFHYETPSRADLGINGIFFSVYMNELVENNLTKICQIIVSRNEKNINKGSTFNLIHSNLTFDC